jgi:hypothetical protein
MDSLVSDRESLIREVRDIQVKNEPIKVVLVGLGNDDFSEMVRFDGIIKFIRFRDVEEQTIVGEPFENLASLVLQDVPSDVV